MLIIVGTGLRVREGSSYSLISYVWKFIFYDKMFKKKSKGHEVLHEPEATVYFLKSPVKAPWNLLDMKSNISF